MAILLSQQDSPPSRAVAQFGSASALGAECREFKSRRPDSVEVLTAKRMSIHWQKLIATGFGIGNIPFAPGSWGTLIGILLCWLLQPLPPLGYLLVTLFLAVLAVPLCTVTERQLGKKDSPAIVLDEIVAFPLTMFLVHWSLPTLILAFVLNRFFDITKIWPCHSLQSLSGGWGIVLDDLVAAIYSCALLHAIIYLWPGVNRLLHQ